MGDSPETDVAGAQAAGVRAVLVDRAGAAADIEGVERIFTLEGLDELVLAPLPRLDVSDATLTETFETCGHRPPTGRAQRGRRRAGG